MSLMIKYFVRIATTSHRANVSNKDDQLTLDFQEKNVDSSAQYLRHELEELLIRLSTRWIKEERKKVDFDKEGFKLQSDNPNVSKYIIYALYVS